jgi:hypothetical protein
MTTANSIIITGLPRVQATALRSRASRLGMSAEDYLKDLIEQDNRLDRLAASKTFAELATPFSKALAGLSDDDLDAIARPRKRKAKR